MTLSTMLLLLLLKLLVTASMIQAQGTLTTHTVTPDLAGMIYPPTSASRVVRFGDPSSSLPSAYEYIAPSTDPVACTDARLCLELQISSVFEVDPFFLHGYDTNTPLVSATFHGFDSSDILPIIPGSTAGDTELTKWRFQTDASPSAWSSTHTAPSIDLLLRLRQRSQRRSALDQLLVRVRIELEDPRTITIPIETRSVYGNQLVEHTTTRIDSKTIQVLLSITRSAQQRDIGLLDAYPVVTSGNSANEGDASSGASTCETCGDFLDACQEIEPCQKVVLPCLISQLEAMASGTTSSASGSGYDVDVGSYTSQNIGTNDMEAVAAETLSDNDGSNGSYALGALHADVFRDSGNFERFLTDPELVSQEESTTTTYSNTARGSAGSTGSGQSEVDGTKQMDLLGPIATCVADLPLFTWIPLRRAIFCLSLSECALGVATGIYAGEQAATHLRLTAGLQRFVITPTMSETENVELTIAMRRNGWSTADHKSFTFSASVSKLGIFLRSFVLVQAANATVMIEPYVTNPSEFLVTLTYSEALLQSLPEFYTKEGQVSMVENLPAQAAIEYPASSPRPVLDKLLNELRARIHSPGQTNHSWILAQECLSCSAQFFGCSAEAIADHSCSYNAMKSTIGKCIEQQLPATSYEAMIQGSFSEKPVSAELSRCVLATAASADTATGTISSLMRASSSLACFAASRCPFGPIELVRDTKSIMLETTSYIQVLRISLSSLTDTMSIKIEYKVGDMLIGSTATIYSTSSKYEIEQVIKKVLALAGIEVSVSTLIGENTKTEWVLEIVYHYVFLSAKFSADAVVNGALAKSDAMKQIMMEGGAAELRAVPRDRSKILSEAEIDHPSVSASHGMDTNSSHSGEGSIEGSGPSADPSSESSSIGSHPGADSSSSSVSGSLGQDDEGFVSSSGSDLDDEGSGSLGHDDVGYTSLSGSGSIGTDDAGLSSSSGSDFDKGSSDSKTLGPVDASYVSSSGSGDLGPDGAEYTSSSGSDFDDAASSDSGALNTDDAGHASSSGSGSPGFGDAGVDSSSGSGLSPDGSSNSDTLWPSDGGYLSSSGSGTFDASSDDASDGGSPSSSAAYESFKNW